ncbi:RND family efflux transporter MFP subunit [Myxococcus stipitatus DSM 14675]|uniref:RND family efflux transporter MFP subunit n=1 Tax=Myxococcus stipitatus (strain DSM 14675 / JCM 12634 / Mx s8) TaxID=1278073 RepID=L7UJB2_MYXSD|nr:efflux RND transporter periplasmic adaptor subunit [Myxococcus stipitatus]AGC46539.1 RND family efflux transporter MFP subunit [Myxococcus stipitatus DSM 14675]
MRWELSEMRARARRWSVLLAAGGLVSVSACRTADAPAKTSSETARPVARTATETFRVESSRLESHLRLPAELMADQTVDVYAKVNSYVKHLRVDIGAVVRKGDVLVTLEAPEIEAQLASAKARLAAMEALHVASKATYERTLKTSQTEGAVARDAIDQARAKEQADAAQVVAARATHDELAAMKGYLVMKAPFDGVVTERNVELGAYVGPSGRGSNKPMVVVKALQKMRLTLSIPESYSPYVRLGGAVTFSVRSLPGRVFSATFSRRAGALDAALRSERVEADVDNADGALLPMMVAEARLTLSSPGPTVVLPRTAVVESGMGTYVLRIQDGAARRIPVTRGLRVGEKIEVFGALEAGDELVLRATEEMKEGMRVAEG